MDAAQLRVVEAIRSGADTWNSIQAVTEFNNDYLGLALGELFCKGKIRTEHRDEVRIYRLRA